MKRTFDGIQVFLIVAVSLFILTLPAYLRYTQLSQMKFVSSDLGFENPDQVEGLADSEKELDAYGLSAFLFVFHLATHLFEHSPFFFQTLSLQQGAVVLRC